MVVFQPFSHILNKNYASAISPVILIEQDTFIAPAPVIETTTERNLATSHVGQAGKDPTGIVVAVITIDPGTSGPQEDTMTT